MSSRSRAVRLRGRRGLGLRVQRRGRDRHQRACRHHGRGRREQGAAQVYVEFADGNRVEARVLGHDPNADIALLRVDPKGLTLRAAAARRQRGSARSASRWRRSARRSGRRSRCRWASSPRSTARRVLDRLRDLRRDPDGRGDQPGQLRRAAGRRRRARDRGQPADPVASGGGEGVGFAVPIDVVKRSIDQLREAGTARVRLPRRVARCRCIRSSSSTSS